MNRRETARKLKRDIINYPLNKDPLPKGVKVRRTHNTEHGEDTASYKGKDIAVHDRKYGLWGENKNWKPATKKISKDKK